MFSEADAELTTAGHREQVLHGLIWLVIWNQGIEADDGRFDRNEELLALTSQE